MATVIEVNEARKPQLDIVTLRGKRVYHVFFDAFDEDYGSLVIKAATATGIPQNGTNFDGNNPATGEALVVGVNAKLFEEQNKIWEVSVSFGPAQANTGGGGDGGGQDEYPWNIPPVYNWGHTFVEDVISADVNGKDILNSAGEAFDTAVLSSIAIRTVSVTWSAKVGSFNPNKASDLINTINSGSFSIGGVGISKKEALLTSYGGTRTSAIIDGNRQEYWQASASWNILNGNFNTWQGYVLDQGKHQLIKNGNKDVKYNIKNKFGDVYTSPQLLNGGGKRLYEADGTKNSKGSNKWLDKSTASHLSGTDGVYLGYDKYESASHSGII